MDEGKIIQLKIKLRSTSPPIWRRILVQEHTALFELHEIIQIAMGWQNCHLFLFQINGQIYDEHGDLDIWMGDEEDVKQEGILEAFSPLDFSLEELITQTDQKFAYIYDFGDNWYHEILVEKFLPIDPDLNYPVCIGGKMQCPPEDIGGLYGFYEMLYILEGKDSREKASLLKWLNKPYEPKYFDIESVNEHLLALE